MLGILSRNCSIKFFFAGFLVSAYLIEVFDWSVDMAVNSYIAARPPGIYKEESFNINRLFNWFKGRVS